jgi:hypothetical protein
MFSILYIVCYIFGFRVQNVAMIFMSSSHLLEKKMLLIMTLAIKFIIKWKMSSHTHYTPASINIKYLMGDVVSVKEANKHKTYL